MKRTSTLFGILAASGLLLVTSCSKNMFDPDTYERIIEIGSPVDSVAENHTWMLTTARSYRVTANAGVNAAKVLLLTDNPFNSSNNAEVMAQATIANGETKTLTALVPDALTEIYAALVDTDGAYTVVSANATAGEIDFTSPIIRQTRTTTVPGNQTFTYCFEEEFPEPGDYDYNDIVLQVSHEVVSDRQVNIQVTLAAVGGDKEMGAAIRLVGYSYTDIDSISTEYGRSFYKDIPKSLLYVIETTKPLIEGRNHEAVVNLFSDAHWATGDLLNADFGVITRKKYNVSNGSNSDFQEIPPRTITYQVYFKPGTDLTGFSMASLDPFMIEPYNGAFWEVHTRRYIDAQTLHEYNAASVKNLPWTLEVPSSQFRHTIEGANIGFYRDGQLFGAYMTQGHSFGEWAQDPTQCLDWYNYPTLNQVY